MSKWAKPAHKKAAKVLGYALTLGTADAWLKLRFVLVAKLSTRERAALAYAALSSLSDEDGYMIASEVLFSTGEAV